MIWNSWQEFFAMGGYALYVWGSLAATAACLVAEVWQLRLRGKAIRQQLRRRAPHNMSKTGAKHESAA